MSANDNPDPTGAPPGSGAADVAFCETDYLAANSDVAAAVVRGEFQSGAEHYRLFGRSEGRSLAPARREPVADAATEQQAAPYQRFEHRAPSAQTAVDVFRGRWASDLSRVLGVDGTGTSGLFDADDRPALAAKALGSDGRIDGFTVLELGPLEAGHTRSLELLGAASVVGVESNVEAWLKCLVVKELCGLHRSTFLLGDVVEYLRAEPGRFDMVFCSGILYHMADPIGLIEAISRVTDRCFVWTHHFRSDRQNVPYTSRPHATGGFTATYWSHDYGDKNAGFWGGNRSTASWLEREPLLAAFRHFGFDQITVHRDDDTSPNGPNITFSARRSARG